MACIRGYYSNGQYVLQLRVSLAVKCRDESTQTGSSWTVVCGSYVAPGSERGMWTWPGQQTGSTHPAADYTTNRVKSFVSTPYFGSNGWMVWGISFIVGSSVFVKCVLLIRLFVDVDITERMEQDGKPWRRGGTERRKTKNGKIMEMKFCLKKISRPTLTKYFENNVSTNWYIVTIVWKMYCAVKKFPDSTWIQQIFRCQPFWRIKLSTVRVAESRSSPGIFCLHYACQERAFKINLYDQTSLYTMVLL